MGKSPAIFYERGWEMMKNQMKKLMMGAAVLGATMAFGISADAAVDAAGAKEIAFRHAGCTEADTRNLHVEQDREHGILIYEVEFRVGNTKYEYEIREDTGEIIEYSYKSR